MFTYLRQPRHIRLLGGKSPSFPALASVTFHVSPGQAFGAEAGCIRAVRLGSDFHMGWDANCDRDISYPDPGFARMQLNVPSLGGEFSVDGSDVTFRIEVASSRELGRHVGLLQFALPAGLSALLPDPVYVSSIDGMIGDVPFRVEHVASVAPLIILSDALLAERVSKALTSLGLLAKQSGLRLLAATRYVHNASRLLAAGYSPWEFMAEALLNYAKTVEVLFGDSRDAQLDGMRAMGVEEADIDARFIPVTLLRDFLDVAHPKLSQLDGERLKGLYLFLVGLERDFQDLLAKARNAVSSGAWTPLSTTSKGLDPADLKTLDRILVADALHREAEARKAEARKADA